MKKKLQNSILYLLSVLTVSCSLLTLQSCIEPPLKLPAEEVLVDLPVVQVDLDVVWNLDIDWETDWRYGWDSIDKQLWGDIEYPIPSNYEVRRYFLGPQPHVPHTNVDAFTIYTNRFRRTYEFGYYDLLLWSNIDSDDGTQVVTIDESNIDETTASTTVTRGMTRVSNSTTITTGTTLLTGTSNSTVVTGLFNQPEIFYSAYPRDIFISRNKEDYDYFDEVERCWVKQIDCLLDPLVYIYLVQVIIYNNKNGKIITGSTGDNAISSFATGTSVNTGHTWNKPGLVYYGSRFKKGIDIDGRSADIIGGKFTTYGLCDMDCYHLTKDSLYYTGSRRDLRNYLYVDLTFYNGATATLQADVTEQCWRQHHGGIITVIIDANDFDIPPGPGPGPSPTPGGPGSLFIPTVEDYDEVVYDLVIGGK